MRKPGILNCRWPELRRAANSGICRGLSSGVRRVDMRKPTEKRRPIRQTVEDLVREFHAKTFTNQERSKVKVVVPKSPGLECELVADL
jgi:GTP cyclohydrolase FolE2